MKLNIRLMKKDTAIVDVLKENSGLVRKDWENESIKLYIEEKGSEVKGWKNFINEGAAEEIFERNGVIASALLFVPVSDNQYMILTFGQGFSKLRESKLERDFGLKVVLNSVDYKKIRSLDTVKHDEITIHKKTQTSQQSEVSAFGIDIESDMLREITGTPTNSRFATDVTGRHALSINTILEVNDILDKCQEIFTVYQQDGYQTHFSWVDNIRHVEDIETIENLDNILLEDVKHTLEHKEQIDLHLAPPEIVDYSRVTFIRYRGYRSRELYDTLHIDDYINMLIEKSVNVEDIAVFKKHKVEFLDEDELEINSWYIYDCMVYETEYEDEQYILSDGKWYKIAKSLSDEVNEFFDSLLDPLSLPNAYIDENEQGYNKRLKDDLKKDDYICFDTKLIKLPEWTSGIEPCDFFSPQKQFIHIKNDASSSKLSHLFNQGVVSGESFLREQEFRKQFKRKARGMNSTIASVLPDVRHRPELNEYQIVFAVMRKPYRDGSFGLPFFSKVSLKNASQRLTDFGYKIGFSWIAKTDVRADDEE
ncbi:MAG: TIGR04141 family sporadically distributed protein [Sulfurovum sp.]|nr:TIGR04141 family sporadically distributed protein [Sulfurovum sp.]